MSIGIIFHDPKSGRDPPVKDPQCIDFSLTNMDCFHKSIYELSVVLSFIRRYDFSRPPDLENNNDQ